MAGVQKNGKYGYIDPKGEIVIPFQFDFSGQFSEGLAQVIKDGKTSYINKKGSEVISLDDSYDIAVNEDYSGEYGFANGHLTNGVLIVQNTEGRYGLLNKQGQLVVPLEYDYIVQLIDSEKMIEREGDIVKVKKNNKYGLINSSGEVVLPLEYEDITSFSDKLLVVKINGKYGLVDEKGRVVIDLKYDELGAISSNMAVAVKDEDYKFINRCGVEEQGLGVYEYAGSFIDGLALVRKGGKYGFINNKGQAVISIIYDFASEFNGDLALVEKGGARHYVNKRGEKIAEH
ncbi:WG repeat-containing protein [Psychrobacter sp. BI730]|nr:WG repeat-containing protein [Psychrobacter sp. BI730]